MPSLRAIPAKALTRCPAAKLRVRWYITYRRSYRDLVAMMAERGVDVSHTTILRWVLRYVPEFEKRWRRFARRVNSSRRVDETSVRVRVGCGRQRRTWSLKQLWDRALA